LGDDLREYSQATELLQSTSTNHAKSFYSGVLIALNAEMEQMKADIENNASLSTGNYSI
jgi:hypothetical protein